ncbi:MAG TPA: LCP family protein [Candidatus Saccharimonadales bacterium]|nr:LCP family protein [Candidatus Saccharimonadales bacterium]
MRTYSESPKSSTNLVKILILTITAAIILFAVAKIFHIERFLLSGPGSVIQLVTGSGIKSYHGRTNILLLGIGGEGHDGPNLSDTMILASIDKEGKDPVLISIPRDLWAPTLPGKINSAYAIGQEKDGEGLKLAEDTVSKLLGVPIHYGARMDFSGFEKAVDTVGGLDIEVDNSFTDYMYPISGKENDLCGYKIEYQEVDGTKTQVVTGASSSAIPLWEITDANTPFTCRYETLNFQKGPLHLDGTTALKFVRSRHGTNEEGSDFARAARQQKVILAFRQKVISSQTLLSPTTIVSLISTFDKSIDTDITNDDIPLFIKLGQKIDPATIRRVVLDAGRNESVLDVGDASKYNGQYVLDPKTDNWTDLAEYVQGEIFKLQAK